MKRLERNKLMRLCDNASLSGKIGKLEILEIRNGLNSRVWSKTRKVVIPGWYAIYMEHAYGTRFAIQYFEICELPDAVTKIMGPIAMKDNTLL